MLGTWNNRPVALKWFREKIDYRSQLASDAFFTPFRSFLPLFFARALWQIALPPLRGAAAIYHRPLGGWEAFK